MGEDNGKQARHGWGCNDDTYSKDDAGNWLPCDCGLDELRKDSERFTHVMQHALELVDWEGESLESVEDIDRAIEKLAKDSTSAE